ncbi:uncharacterized protein PRCAT00004841001 [Priceomyces carsonii]|uniref:uncharacterized protein n=1 Tax=Priceomyces carsonii TaxID=28549 RepID=UPI002ED7FD7C|nr:unnamed protein product [Priceomyces carsonii]
MDNRRISRPYSSKDVSGHRGNRGLFSRVKRFFNSQWTHNNKEEQNIEKNQAKLHFQTSSNTNPNSQTDSDISSFRTPSNSRVKTVDNQGTPNETLSSFFHEKGSNPLTATEYEEVLSLISKSRSRSATPAVIKDDHTTPRNAKNDSTFSTPLNQRLIKNNAPPTVFSTPEYKPVYQTIVEKSTPRNIPTVKRVYQFSGLPSPYRTRISVPASLKKQKREETELTLPSEHSSPLINRDEQKSETASAILSILDGEKDTTSTKAEDRTSKRSRSDTLKAFSNPYATSHSLKKKKTKHSPAPVMLTTDDITKSISYNKTEELPANSLIFSNGADKEEKLDGVSSQPSLPKSGGVDSVTTKSAWEVPSSNSVTKTFDLNRFSTEPHLKTSKVPLKTLNNSIKFEFPNVTPAPVVLNQEKVIRYRNLFEF